MSGRIGRVYHDIRFIGSEWRLSDLPLRHIKGKTRGGQGSTFFRSLIKSDLTLASSVEARLRYRLSSRILRRI